MSKAEKIHEIVKKECDQKHYEYKKIWCEDPQNKEELCAAADCPIVAAIIKVKE